MTPHDLLANFETLAEAPNGIQRLRELVLELAVRGKLVEQNDREEPAESLLKRIAKKTLALVRAKSIRKPKDLEDIDPTQIPFDAPPGWKWSRLDRISTWPLQDGDWIESKDQELNGKVRLVQLADVGVGEFRYRSDRFLTEETASRLSCTYLEPGDVLIARLPNPIGRACIFPGWDRPCVTAVDVAIARLGEEMDAKYVVHAMNSNSLKAQVEAYGKGVTRFRVSTGHLRTLLFPVPPIEEQLRIVARVDELMALLDRLEAKRQERDTARTAARDSALTALRAAPTPDDVEAAWLRIQERFRELVATPEDVEPLRQALLQLAVQGKLLPQSPEDPSGASLLEEIEQVKAEAVHVGQRRSAGTKSETPLIESSNMLPLGWARARLGDILWECRNGLSKTPNDAGEGFKLLRISAATANPKWIVNCLDHRWVNVSAEEAKQYRVHAGDLLSCRFNGNLHFVGKVAQVPEIDLETYLYPDKLIRLRPILVNPRFLCFAINAGPSRSQIESFAATTAGNIGINGTQLQSIVVPIPSLPEQARIVARVDELMALLDRLSKSLSNHFDDSSALAAAAVHHLEA